MICLRCGWCCANISPLVTGNEERKTPMPCPHLIYDGKMAVCQIYPQRPKQCRNEHMGVGENDPCPIGLSAMERDETAQPTGRCHYCSGLVYDSSSFCSQECGEKCIDELNNSW